ncbi:MAG TPA: proline--tRNA ligase [Patescibacteria group bacterium]
MKYSKLFGKTSYGEQGGSDMTSHQLLLKGGFIRESVAGRYFFLPLGWRVHEKIKAVIKEEMDKAGAQEMISPVLHPLELWQETNRTSTTGFELMKVTDRRDAEFALGGTAEEMFVDVVRKLNLTYKDLPFNIYQFSTKFRDEMRARGGLLRVREFVMKDAYSFHKDAKDFKQEYDQMAETYTTIFKRLGLGTHMVEADNGYIGGEYCHEFQVEHELGEGRFFISEDSQYVAHEDVAKFEHENKNVDEELKEYQEIEAVRGNTMEDGVKLHGLPLWQQMKDVMFADREGQLYLAVIRGDLDVNKTKLEQVLNKVGQLESATEEQIRAIGSEPGFISPVGLADKVTIIGDLSLRTVKNFYGGANQKHRDAMNMNIDRDFTVQIEADIAMAQAGFQAPDNHGALIEKRGIEVGNIFQLGYHYTTLMKDAHFVDADGKTKPFYMGCYGIGLGRTLATIVEKHHDDKGIIWPEIIAPFQVHLVSLSGAEEQAEEVYQTLTKAGIDVLWDDRNESAGKKFADADLIGIPVRLVVSPRTGDQVEWKRRDGVETELISLNEIVVRLAK